MSKKWYAKVTQDGKTVKIGIEKRIDERDNKTRFFIITEDTNEITRREPSLVDATQDIFKMWGALDSFEWI